MFNTTDEVEAVAEVVADGIKTACAPLVSRITALEQRCKDLEARPRGVVDGGVYKAGEIYEAGTGCTWDGSFWIAQRTTASQPGSGPPEATGWRLAVKRGRDAR